MATASVPVYVENKFVRFVTSKQRAAEVAGKVLRKSPDQWRSARRTDAGWTAFYFTPSDDQKREWEERGKKPLTGHERFAH